MGVRRVNADKQAIQTNKNQFISDLFGTDINFTILIWDTLLVKAQDTLNMWEKYVKIPDSQHTHNLAAL